MIQTKKLKADFCAKHEQIEKGMKELDGFMNSTRETQKDSLNIDLLNNSRIIANRVTQRFNSEMNDVLIYQKDNQVNYQMIGMLQDNIMGELDNVKVIMQNSDLINIGKRMLIYNSRCRIYLERQLNAAKKDVNDLFNQQNDSADSVLLDKIMFEFLPFDKNSKKSIEDKEKIAKVELQDFFNILKKVYNNFLKNFGSFFSIQIPIFCKFYYRTIIFVILF